MTKTILLIEDDEIMADLVERKLKNEGYNVLIGRDGQEGLEITKRQLPDLILLDLIMPKMDGFGVMEEIQKDEALKKIPLIIISNSGQPVELSRARRLGAADWLIKTEFDPRALVEKIKNQLNKQHHGK